MFGKKKASRQMSVSNIIAASPIAREIMSSHGIKFIGKDLSPLEPLEKVAKGNGLDDKEIDKMLSEINNYKENKNFSIEVSNDAANKLKEVMKEKGRKAVRLRLYSDGCALYTYDMDFTSVKPSNDIEVTINGVKFYVEKKSIDFLNGITINFDNAKNGFIFNNPNIKT